MMPDEYRQDIAPEEAATVDSPQVPVPVQKWSWDTNTLMWVGIGVLALGFGIYFVMSFSSAKTRAITAAVQEAASNDS